MSTVAARHGDADASSHRWSERLFSAVPLASAFVWLCLLYGWQAWSLRSPWLFADELDYTQLARSIADTGHPGRRGESESFATLYAYLTAPAWLFDRTETAYQAAKLIGVVTMTSALFPAYALARMLVSRGPALFAAIASAAIPAFAYSSLLLTETLAYPYAAMCFFLIVKALTSRGTRWLVLATAACLLAPLVRGQLALLPAVFAGSAALLAWSGEWGRARRAGWSWIEWTAAAAVAGVGALFASELIGRFWGQWEAATQHPRSMLDHAVWAAGALVIGLGVLPLLAAVAGAWRPGGSPAHRPFVAVLATAALGFCLYTAGKAAFLATFFESRVEERNLIYLSPLLFVAAAVWLEQGKTRLVPLGLAVAGAALLIVVTPYELDPSALYADAPSLSILSYANQYFDWDDGAVQTALLVVLGVSTALILGVAAIRERRTALIGIAALVLAWNVTAEMAASDASDAFADKLATEVPQPFDWVDRATGGEATVYLGQGILNANAIHLLEFWNRSITRVWTRDDTAPGPGPTETPRLAAPDGTLSPDTGARYVLADIGIEPQGTEVAEAGRWKLYRLDGPLALQRDVTGLYSDGWIGSDATYSQYSTQGGRLGIASVRTSRLGSCGLDPGARVRISIGPLALDASGNPTFARVREVQRHRLRSCTSPIFLLFSPPPPFHVRVHIEPTFVPAEEDPRETDRRELGAQVSFGFVPATGSPGARPGPRERRPPRTRPAGGTP